MIFGICYRLLGGLFVDKIDAKVDDNQGIYKSLKNSLVFGIIFIPIGVLTSMALHYFYEPMQLSTIFVQGSEIGFGLGVFIGGFLCVIQHSALRITLWLFGYAPWNYSKFLRYCTDRGFLQRVGGGYRFVHALLRDHFAEHYDPS